jgi:hypothetical protein
MATNKYFQKINVCDFETLCETSFLARSIVVYNSAKGVAYNIVAKNRNKDAYSICKSLIKAVLAEKYVVANLKKDSDVDGSGIVISSIVSVALGGNYLFATDQNGRILVGDDVLYAGDDDTLRKRFSVRKGMPIYDLFMERGTWDDTEITEALDMWSRATIKAWDYKSRIVEGLVVAAESTYEQQKTAILAARKEQHDKMSASQLAIEAAITKKKQQKKNAKRNKKSEKCA